jgi:hypothetical protein
VTDESTDRSGSPAEGTTGNTSPKNASQVNADAVNAGAVNADAVNADAANAGARPAAVPMTASRPASASAPAAVAAVAGSLGTTAALLAQRRIHLPRGNVGRQLRFADGSHATVYRETAVEHGDIADPAVLVVAFRLRAVHGRARHRWFRIESILNTPLFAGFPGFVSALWLSHDQHGVYRGIYQWDGADHAEAYARTLARVLSVGSVPGSIRFQVLPGMRRDEFVRDPGAFGSTRHAIGPDWWRPGQPISNPGRVREPE